MTNRYKRGDWYAICDVCGFKYHASQIRERWDGARVCWKDYEIRQPQDFARVVRDDPTPPWQRPPPADTFVSPGVCTVWGRSAIPGYAVPGCAIPGFTPVLEPPP